jgi:hypothetical protein
MFEWRDHLSSDPDVCGGQLCARGMRVLVTNILDSLAGSLRMRRSCAACDEPPPRCLQTPRNRVRQLDFV